ncbi:MAG: hypothetical protein K2Q15_07005, partial [Burkholderiales bacterium]|nr:hypothetical protein [Burkholderiales bacterium]
MTLKFIVIFVLVLLSSVLMIAWRIFAPIDAVQENEPLIVDISENRSPIKNNTPAVFQEKLPILAEVPTAQIIVPATVILPKAESVSQIIAPSKEIDLVNLKFPTLSIENINKYSVPSYSNILNANNEVFPSPEDNAVNEKTKLINAPLFPIFLEAES